MDVQIVIKNLDGVETINVNNVMDKNDFNYIDSYGAENHVSITNNELVEIERLTMSHSTYVSLNRESGFIEIDSKEGRLNFDLKVVEFDVKDNIITMAYILADELKKIIIKYVGV